MDAICMQTFRNSLCFRDEVWQRFFLNDDMCGSDGSFLVQTPDVQFMHRSDSINLACHELILSFMSNV